MGQSVMIGAIRRQASAVADPGERGRVVVSVVNNKKYKLDWSAPQK